MNLTIKCNTNHSLDVFDGMTISGYKLILSPYVPQIKYCNMGGKWSDGCSVYESVVIGSILDENCSFTPTWEQPSSFSLGVEETLVERNCTRGCPYVISGPNLALAIAFPAIYLLTYFVSLMILCGERPIKHLKHCRLLIDMGDSLYWPIRLIAPQLIWIIRLIGPIRQREVSSVLGEKKIRVVSFDNFKKGDLQSTIELSHSELSDVTFISHKWFNDKPDDQNCSLFNFITMTVKTRYIWIDYICAMGDEHTMLNISQALTQIPSMKFIIASVNEASYKRSLWCNIELLCARRTVFYSETYTLSQMEDVLLMKLIIDQIPRIRKNWRNRNFLLKFYELYDKVMFLNENCLVNDLALNDFKRTERIKWYPFHVWLSGFQLVMEWPVLYMVYDGKIGQAKVSDLFWKPGKVLDTMVQLSNEDLGEGRDFMIIRSNLLNKDILLKIKTLIVYNDEFAFDLNGGAFSFKYAIWARIRHDTTKPGCHCDLTNYYDYISLKRHFRAVKQGTLSNMVT